MPLPTYDEIIALHKKYAPSDAVFTTCYTHSEIVRDIALQLAENFDSPLDTELVVAGCLLHDIGYYPLMNTDGTLLPGRMAIEHGIAGEELLRAERLPEELCRIASHHTGAGLLKEDIIKRQLPLPHQDFLATSNEEKLVMYADKFHSKSNGGVFNSCEWYEQHVAQYGEENLAMFHALSELFGKPDLRPIIENYQQTVRDL